MRFKRIRSVTAKSSIQSAVAAVASSLSDTMSSMLMQRRAWGRYTPAQREARIRKMLAGRGITRKSKVKA